MRRSTTEKPKRAPLPKGITAENITFEQADTLLHLPKVLDEDIEVNIGKFGQYIKQGNKTCSLKGADNIFNITAERAKELLSGAKEKEPEKVLAQSEKGENIILVKGRYGYYLKCGKTNYAIPKGKKYDELTEADAKAIVTAKK